MNLYIIRHAIARPAAAGEPDSQRPLTAKGKKRFGKEVAGMQALGMRFDALYHSPWLRAEQTAKLVRRLSDRTIELPQLAGPPSAGLLERLDGEDVAVVGHEPWLSELAAWLVHERAGLGAGRKLKKGGLVWLSGELTPGSMELMALAPPRWLRALG
jgi:phosphohistidine phosphatase